MASARDGVPMQSPEYRSETPFSSFTVINNHTFSTKHLEIHHNGKPILWVETQSGLFVTPQLDIHRGSATGPIVAAARLRKAGSGCRVFVGNPSNVPKEQWMEIGAESFTKKQYSFRYENQWLLWKRTHRAELGASGWGSRDFKLVDATDENKILAVYLNQQKLFSDRHILGKIDWYADLGQNAELASLAAILGIEEKIRRAARSSNSAGGGGGGGGA